MENLDLERKRMVDINRKTKRCNTDGCNRRTHTARQRCWPCNNAIQEQFDKQSSETIRVIINGLKDRKSGRAILSAANKEMLRQEQ